MSGIWGFMSLQPWDSDRIQSMVNRFLVLSQNGGTGDFGVAVAVNGQHHQLTCSEGRRKLRFQIKDLLAAIPATGSGCNTGFAVIGILQPRLDNENTPVMSVSKQGVKSVFQGCTVNAQELLQDSPEIEQLANIETQAVHWLLEQQLAMGNEPAEAVNEVYKKVRGISNTLCLFASKNRIGAFSNNGGLYWTSAQDEKSIIFASSFRMLKGFSNSGESAYLNLANTEIKQFQPNTGMLVDFDTLEITKLFLPAGQRASMNNAFNRAPAVATHLRDYSEFNIDDSPIRELKRCTKCVLPETMPFIEFDKDGVCNYCRSYEKQKYEPEGSLEKWADGIRRTDGRADSIVAFSGGRDSSFGLHYFVKKLGLHPVAFSYDWGMGTDIARRNQSLMCAELGIELVQVTADCKKKRDNIRRNVLAWLKNPDLGMVPLFMAGDKQYFYYANAVRKEYGLDTVLMASNPFEKTHFKAAFSGVRPAVLEKGFGNMEVEQMKRGGVLRMAAHYGGQYLKNPAYINRSLFDTVRATASYYAIPHDYMRLFNYIPWDEKTVDEVLISQYGWEVCPHTTSTWRIGDGTAPFYNYIYYYAAGFTENDTLRSNQIREGMLTRDEALEMIYKENAPRFEPMRWYFESIGLEMEPVLARVKKMNKLYNKG